MRASVGILLLFVRTKEKERLVADALMRSHGDSACSVDRRHGCQDSNITRLRKSQPAELLGYADAENSGARHMREHFFGISLFSSHSVALTWSLEKRSIESRTIFTVSAVSLGK